MLKKIIMLTVLFCFLSSMFVFADTTSNTTFSVTSGRVLKEGQSGRDVYYLKYCLKELGFDVETGGFIFDKETKTSIMQFQKENNLKADGLVGKNTVSVLKDQLKGKDMKVPVPKVDIKETPSKGYWIVINKSNNTLTLFKDKEIIKTYPVATGKTPKLTPEGKFTIVSKVVNPAWGGGGYAKPVAGGSPKNPLGYRWMGLSIGGGGSYGIHGTTAPKSIGTYASHGCIRMHNEDSKELFDIVPKKTPVWIGTSSKIEGWGIKNLY